MRRVGGLFGAFALTVSVGCTLASTASAAPACSAAPAAGGEWPMYGNDLADTRSQPSEHVIGAGNAKSLKRAWIFKTSSVGDGSAFQTTPAVDGGCAFIGSTAGQVYAIGMATGKLVWKHQLTVAHPGLGGAIATVGSEAGAGLPPGQGAFLIAYRLPR